MNEGSVEVDEGSLPTGSMGDDSQIEDTDQGEDTDTEDTGAERSETESTEGEEDTKYTEKGTKLDSNPLSAAHQELANERRIRQQYEKVLGTPELLKKYAQESGLTIAEAKAEIKEEKALYAPDRFKTTGDIADALNEMQTNFQKELETLRTENKQLKEGFTGFSESRHVEQVANTMQKDILAVQEKYPALNPKSPEYDADLDKEIADLYHELDFDEANGGYKGKQSIAKLTDRIMRAAGKAKQKGSQEAQTNVRVKQAGKVVTSSKTPSKEDAGSKDPGTAIAQKIARALRNQ